MNYAVYDETGRIDGIFGCDAECIALNVKAGQFFIEIAPHISGATHYIDRSGDPDFPIEFPEKPGEFHEWDWPTLDWALPPSALDSAKAKQSAALNAACQAEIFAGFESAALGSLHHYPAKITDQNNLVASVTASLYTGLPSGWTTPFWCESGGSWSYSVHTAAQIQQAGADGKTAILVALTRNEGLQQQVQAATSIEQVQAVV